MLCPASQAQFYSTTDTVSIVADSGHPGDTIVVPFDLFNTFAVGGFLFRVTFDSLFFVPISMNLTQRTQGFDLYGANFDQPGVASFFGTSMHPMDSPVMPGRGPIVSLAFAIRNFAIPDSYYVHFDESDSLQPQNQLSNITGDSLVIPVLVDGPIIVLAPQSAEEGQSLPMRFGLAQNYPNPFNASTRISFTLPGPDDVTLTVFDLLGRNITDLYSGPVSAGETVVSWDGRNSRGECVVSGVYFYRLEAEGGQVVTKRMTLLK
jgi:hypothetical protein